MCEKPTRKRFNSYLRCDLGKDITHATHLESKCWSCCVWTEEIDIFRKAEYSRQKTVLCVPACIQLIHIDLICF